jgi:SAM-dependent methyltransferase
MDIDKLIKEKSGIRLDIGCGGNKNQGFVGIDILPLPGVDIVHDLETFPWPLPDECVTTAVASHVLEHINPHKGVFIGFMNEVWRVLKPGGQFAFVVPYAESFGMFQDPTHCNFINEATMYYFDPLHPSNFYQFYHPKPWKIISQPFSRTGVLECLLEKRPMDKSYLGTKNPVDITKEKFDVKIIRTD